MAALEALISIELSLYLLKSLTTPPASSTINFPAAISQIFILF